MSEDTFDYTQVPKGFMYCQRESCPKAASCLRRLAYERVPADKPCLSILNPRWLDAQKAACPYYLDNQPVRYARGFMRTLDASPVGKSYSLRVRLMSYFGRKNYYLARKGERSLSPREQKAVIQIAQRLDIQLDDYFDGYESRVNWEGTTK